MVLAVVAGFGALACLGLRLDIGGFAPYALLYDHVPGWDRLRSPFRLVVLVTLALGPLVGLGFDRLAGLLRGRSHGRLGTVALCIVILVGLIEVWPRERPLVEVPDVAHQDWVAFLAAADDGEPVAHVPAADPRGRVEDFEPTVVDMLASLEHGHPMLSGYTGLFPPHATVARRRLQSPVDEEVVDLLCLRGVPWVVVDDGLVADDRRLEPAFDGIARDVYRVDCEP